MKRLASIAAMAVLFSAGAVANDWTVGTDDGRADFYVKFKGEVPQRCEMVADNSLKELTFDLAQDKDTHTFKFKAWCNSYGNKGTMYVDPFDFVNSNGDEIPMKYTFKGTTSTKKKGVSTVDARIVKEVKISNKINKKMNREHTLIIESNPQAGARWGEYSGAMYVSLFHM
ncbi:hypothetical protein [Vibrio owensii]|uniref:hypothetical protein n=1 Tax=Vibrio owensii TaxID=696485 RepID=UPI0005979423|nr:hypothetical protein [Vibrio owensii]